MNSPHHHPRLTKRHLATKPVLMLTAEELFELWRSLDVRLYLDEYIEQTPKKPISRLKGLRTSLAKSLRLTRKVQHDFFETYYCNTIESYNHEMFHELINDLGYQEEELDTLSAKELVGQVCQQYNATEE